ncbi:putative mitogen-activated protein kinase kinase kinase STE-STE11 family [Medicago truncatula]|uniref:MAP kinase kinase kinase n=1 Tax=Medicago truncatula TaxID=3880 RepID=A2Q4H0_MEDTR|nr:mitogen-activated protein kinase kinase kinase 17 [Medicago truncatula]ABN08520.1 Protein kinase [Medicago truncatula]AES67203.1 MAP kinase kinase kinase [Medicago truncatula]RHN75544.1 putative mitogen-activated protein kinase kinase kinase STE-STE11 family [Medicago truncatula]
MEMEWTRGNIIGHGSSATVYLATSRRSTDVSAVKSAETSLPNSNQLQSEQRILSSLSSPYIVTYKGCNFSKENNKHLFNLFMEYMPFGNLSQVTCRNGGRLNEAMIAYYTRQIVEGLEYLHSKDVVHCDIKGSNILVCEKGVKIGDFGCAKMIDEIAPAAGTPMYMAPEVARGEEQGFPCDVWSLGCTIVEMATGFSPWSNVEDSVHVLYRVAYSDEVPMIPCFLSEQAKDFLEKCLRRDSKERWSCSQLLKHQFLDCGVEKIEEFDSCSPTSILEQGFWNCDEGSESFFFDDLGKINFVNCPVGRIKKLALCSRDPCWKWGDENWITTRENDADAGSSISDELDFDELEKSDFSGRISGDYFGYDYSNCKIRDVSYVANSLNFGRGIGRLMPQSTLDFL